MPTINFGKQVIEKTYRNGNVTNVTEINQVIVLVSSNAQLMTEIINMLEKAKPKSTVDFQVVIGDGGVPVRIIKSTKVQAL